MHITLSALGPTIAEQCKKQGLEVVGKPADLLDRLSHAITIAHIHGCLTDAETERARNRLMKMLKVRMVTPNVEVTGLAAASLPQGPCGLPGSTPATNGEKHE